MEWTDKQTRTYFKANDGDKRAIRRILRDGEFDSWVQWNEDLWSSVTAMQIATKVIGLDRNDMKKCSEAVKFVKAYLASSKNHVARWLPILLIVASKREHSFKP
jgi:hypothetical protein